MSDPFEPSPVYLDRPGGARSPERPSQDPAETGADWSPAVNVSSTPERYLLRFDVPGVPARSIDLTVEGQTLTVRGTRPAPGGSDEAPLRQELPRGRFLRRLSLPDSVDAARIEAVSRLGMLEVSVPRKRAEEIRRIAVDGE